MGCFCGEGIELHMVQGSNFINDMFCGQYWNISINISYLPRLPRFGGYLGGRKKAD